MSPPSGSPIQMPKEAVGVYGGAVANLASLPGGTYQLSAPGGADIGAFSTSFVAGAPLIWTNSNIGANTIDRSQPLTFTWTGGDAQSSVSIGLSSTSVNLSTGSVAIAIISCSAPASAGQFTVQPYVLLSLIPGANVAATLSSFGSESITIPGIDYSSAFWDWSTSATSTIAVYK
jgi:hypothetical protein